MLSKVSTCGLRRIGQPMCTVGATALTPCVAAAAQQRRWNSTCESPSSAAPATAAATTTSSSTSQSHAAPEGMPATTSSNSSTTSTTTSSSNSSGPSDNSDAFSHRALLERYERWLRDQRVDLSLVDVTRSSPVTGRGLYARQRIFSGQIVVSVPMINLGISEASLLQSAVVQRAAPPQLDAVKRNMMVRGLRDPVLFNMMHLAQLLAAERVSPDSFYGPYLDSLPHPAIRDAAVMTSYKDGLDAPTILEWGEHRQEFGNVCHRLCDLWKGPVRPPLQVIDWAWRTVLARQHMLPDRSMTPMAAAGSGLNYSAFGALHNVANQGFSGAVARAMRRVTRVLPEGLGGAQDHSDDFRLVPTLMPILDQIGHVPASNVSVEVVEREGRGPCAELQAIAAIEQGEEIGMSLSRAHTIAFTLYRFGFLPV